MSEIVFQTLVSTATGVGASTGKHTEEAFNENFALVKTYLDALLDIASVTVTSEQITQLKVDTTTTPYSLYYTMDPLDTDPSEVTWYDLDSVGFADVQGNPTDNIALATALNSKANATDVNTLGTTVSALSNTVTGNTTAIANNTRDIATNTQSISSIRGDMVHLVHTPVADGTLYLRYDQVHLRLEYSLDNSTWHNIVDGAVTFGDISGSPTDNNNLVSYVTNAISTAIGGLSTTYALKSTVDAHINNTNNPHQVTKAQVGLGNVDNTADLDKPIPTAMQQEIDNLWARYPETQVLGVSDYRNLFQVPVTGQAVEATVVVTGESMSIASEGIFTCSHTPVAVGSVTITDQFSSVYIVDGSNNVVDEDNNIVGTFAYTTGVITSTGLEITGGTIDYSYTQATVPAGGTINLGHLNIIEGSVSITDGASNYFDDNGDIKDMSDSSVVGSIVYATGIIVSTTLTTTSAALVNYIYESTDSPSDVLYYTNSVFNGTLETLNPHATTYATKGYVDGLIGDIDSVLSTLTTN